MATLRSVVLLAALLLAAAAQAQDRGCEPSGGLEFVCGPKNAEDLVRVPGTKWIIASGMAEGAGGLTLIDSNAHTWSALYPGENPKTAHDAKYPDCTTPPDPAKLQTHGLALRSGSNGHSTVYAVAHGSRESIEVFDVDASGPKPTATWTGCVPMPDDLAANSVASFADGSLVATVLILPGKTFADSIAKRPTGAVYEWSPGKRGFEQVQGTELPGNNGIEVSADGQEMYVVSSGLQTIVAFSHTNPAKQLRSTEPLPFTPDNVHMGPDGRLLTAGMKNDEPACGGTPGPQHTLEKLSTCPRGTIGMAIDPKTMKDTVLVATDANPSFSNATMILPVGNAVWIGSFSGDRVAYTALR
ncbi:MAG TPA: SMP-30/gluconolactonase/LRE family protein [Gammaproteobacteria bacterium]|nr:SMP-30/gluconolactonase/LRE family protein [Gammaproteobacteria bacterium]